MSAIKPFLVAFVLALALVPLCRQLAVRLGRVAQPRADRWHRRPIAMLGGVAIAVAMFAAASLFDVVASRPVLAGCALLAFASGLVDDLTRLKASTKLIVQIALASALLFFGYRVNWVESMTLDSLLTLFWVVGITNAFNLLDNMDGLCGGVSMIAIVGLLLEAANRGVLDTPESRYLAALCGATGGFLVYNVYPASIFMGDAGSLLIGFSFGALTLSTNHHTGGRSNLLTVVAVPVLVLLIPILDTALVTLSRWLSGRPASQGGRDHSSHRLVAMGLSEPRAVAMLWTLAAAGALTSIMLTRFNQTWSLFAAVVFVFGMVLFAVFLGGIRVYDDTEARARRLTPLVVGMMYKRRVAEVLLDFCLITASYYLAYRLRFEDPEEFLRNFSNFSQSLPVIVASQLVAFFAVGVYRGVWRYFSVADTVVMAVSLPLLELLARGLRDRRRAADGIVDAVARVVPARRRLPQPPARDRHARGRLRRRRRRRARRPRAAEEADAGAHHRLRRRCAAQDRHTGARLPGARRFRVARAARRGRGGGARRHRGAEHRGRPDPEAARRLRLARHRAHTPHGGDRGSDRAVQHGHVENRRN